MNPYTPEAAQQKYPGAPQKQSRYPWRASGASRPKPQQNTGGQQEAAPGPQKAPDMSMYSPGQAQPIQPQSQGTPYGAQPDGNYAYATPNNRPAPFTQRYTNFDGTQSEQPNFGQRDAFIQNINDSMLPYYGGKSQGAPQFDFQSMYKQAGDMVKDGWQNPFSMPAQPQQPSLEQQLSQYAPQPQYQQQPSPMQAAWDSGGYASYGKFFEDYPQYAPNPLRRGLQARPPQPQYQPADPVRYDTGPYDPNGGRVIGGDRLPVVAARPTDPYAQFRQDDSGMLYRPGVNAPAGPQQYPQTVYQAHGSKSERPLTYNQTTGMYEGTQGLGQYQRPISLSPQEAAGLPTTSGLHPNASAPQFAGLLAHDTPRNWMPSAEEDAMYRRTGLMR